MYMLINMSDEIYQERNCNSNNLIKLPLNPNKIGIIALDKQFTNYLSKDIIFYILDFIVEPKYKLLEWIPTDKIDNYYLQHNINSITIIENLYKEKKYGEINHYALAKIHGELAMKIFKNTLTNNKLFLMHLLSSNPSAIPILEKYIRHINWCNLSANPNAIHLMEKYINGDYESILLKTQLNKLDWTYLSGNPNAIPILEKNIDKIDWMQLSANPNAISLIEKNINKVYWSYLSSNPNAIPILEKNIDKINWPYLSGNPNAISILEKNIDKIDWCRLSANPKAISIIEKHTDKIDWYKLSANPNAIAILKNHKDKIVWSQLLTNPSIFEIDEIETNKHKEILLTIN